MTAAIYDAIIRNAENKLNDQAVFDPANTTWTLKQGREVAKELERILDKRAHVALAGSVLHSGESNKDLDLIVYPRTDASVVREHVHAALTLMDMWFHRFGMDDGYKHTNEKIEIWVTKDGKRVDIFYMA